MIFIISKVDKLEFDVKGRVELSISIVPAISIFGLVMFIGMGGICQVIFIGIWGIVKFIGKATSIGGTFGILVMFFEASTLSAFTGLPSL